MIINILLVGVSSYSWIDERLIMMNVIRKNRLSFFKTVAIVALFSLWFGNSLLYARNCLFCEILIERTPYTTEYCGLDGADKDIIVELSKTRMKKDKTGRNKTFFVEQIQNHDCYICKQDQLIFIMKPQKKLNPLYAVDECWHSVDRIDFIHHDRLYEVLAKK